MNEIKIIFLNEETKKRYEEQRKIQEEKMKKISDEIRGTNNRN